jgi:hypothetical protein
MGRRQNEESRKAEKRFFIKSKKGMDFDPNTQQRKKIKAT